MHYHNSQNHHSKCPWSIRIECAMQIGITTDRTIEHSHLSRGDTERFVRSTTGLERCREAYWDDHQWQSPLYNMDCTTISRYSTCIHITHRCHNYSYTSYTAKTQCKSFHIRYLCTLYMIYVIRYRYLQLFCWNYYNIGQEFLNCGLRNSKKDCKLLKKAMKMQKAQNNTKYYDFYTFLLTFFSTYDIIESESLNKNYVNWIRMGWGPQKKLFRRESSDYTSLRTLQIGYTVFFLHDITPIQIIMYHNLEVIFIHQCSPFYYGGNVIPTGRCYVSYSGWNNRFIERNYGDQVVLQKQNWSVN